MNKNREKLLNKAAARVLKNLYTNELWFDKPFSKKNAEVNYLFIPLFDIAKASKKYDLSILKDACYLLQKNNHINIWDDGYDSRDIMIQLSEEGVKAYKQSFYGHDMESIIKKGLTYVTAAAM